MLWSGIVCGRGASDTGTPSPRWFGMKASEYWGGGFESVYGAVAAGHVTSKLGAAVSPFRVSRDGVVLWGWGEPRGLGSPFTLAGFFAPVLFISVFVAAVVPHRNFACGMLGVRGNSSRI